jgi:hypothetical protein
MVEPLTVFTGRSLSSAMVCGRSRGRNQIFRVHRIDDVRGRKPVGLHARNIEIDLDLAHLAAIGVRRGRSLHGGELSAQKIVSQVK